MSALTLFNHNNGGDIFEKFFGIDDFWANSLVPKSKDRHTPIVKQLDDSYEISFIAPGLDKKDFKITLEGNHITISYDASDNEESYAYATKYSKSYSIPSDCDLEKISARYKNGVLVVSLFKSESAKPRTIEIK